MKILFKMTSSLLQEVRQDLARPHAFAAERVGFLSCGVARSKGGIMVLASQYHPVADQDYIDDQSVGAMMGADAIRKALQLAYGLKRSMFHVHVHEHEGRPWFSSTDLRENRKFMPDFWHVRPEYPHGALVLSMDSAAGLCWVQANRKPIRISDFDVVGRPMTLLRDWA